MLSQGNSQIGSNNDGGAPYNKGGVLITEVQPRDEADDQFDKSRETDLDDIEQEEKTNMIFNVREAVPPTDYDEPFSKLPGNVSLNKVKQKVKNTYKDMAKAKAKELREKEDSKNQRKLSSINFKN